MSDKVIVDRELLQKIVDSLDSRCGTNAPERTEIIPVLVELLDAPAVDLGFYGRAAARQAIRIKELEAQLASLKPDFPLSAPQAPQPRKAVKLTSEEISQMWIDESFDAASHESCYMRGVRRGEAAFIAKNGLES